MKREKHETRAHKREHNQFIHNQGNLVEKSDNQTALLSSMGLNVVCRYANCNIRLKNAKQRTIHENDAHNWKCGTLNSCDIFLENTMSKKFLPVTTVDVTLLSKQKVICGVI